MKKLMCALVLFALFAAPLTAFADQPQGPEAPRWEEYVPVKYQNPRTDFSKGAAIGELSVGIVLTDLFFTAPIGIPMICHAATKLKNRSYAEKKEIFFNGLNEAEKITNPEEKQIHYDKLLRKCKFTEKKRHKRIKEIAKAQKKAAKGI